MVRAAATSVQNNFSKGFITEATAMNYPENSVLATQNCIFRKNGEVIRRFGIDYEADFVVTDFATIAPFSSAPTPSLLYNTGSLVEFEWNTVNQDGNVSFVILQIGNIISFFKTSDTDEISSRLKSFTIDLTDYQVPTYSSDYGQYVGALPASFASGFGYLFVAHPLCNPIYISYDSTSDTVTATAITITVRDFERLNDTLATDNRPATLSDLHKYNLWNQGWNATAKNAGGTTTNVEAYWDAQRTDIPSNADIWWLFKNSSDVIDATLFDTQALGNTPAPNGHYTYSAFDTARNTALGTSGTLPEVSSNNQRPSLTTFFAGRVWYAGVQANNFGSRIYFSKVIEGATDFGTCYQLADPTSEVDFDLLPTDGGVINIPDIAIVYRLVPVSSTLLVFASNGIWAISGPNGTFTANDYSVSQVSSVSLSSPNSVIVAEGIPLWFSKSGIYTMAFDSTSGRETVNNITETTIQSFFNTIPSANLYYVKGCYNSIDKNVHWLINMGSPSAPIENYQYDTLLVLNLTSQSFSVMVLPTDGPFAAGMIFPTQAAQDPLVNVIGASLVKYVTLGLIGSSGSWGVTFSQFNNETYLDWETFDSVGVDAESYFIQGYQIRGELMRRFQTNWLMIIMKQEDNASCYVRGIWDYANTTDSGRYTTRQQAYRTDGTKDYSRAKMKMRGNGYSLQLEYQSETGKPFTIVGWTTADTGNNIP